MREPMLAADVLADEILAGVDRAETAVINVADPVRASSLLDALRQAYHDALRQAYHGERPRQVRGVVARRPAGRVRGGGR